jgi:hypothetical protein
MREREMRMAAISRSARGKPFESKIGPWKADHDGGLPVGPPEECSGLHRAAAALEASPGPRNETDSFQRGNVLSDFGFNRLLLLQICVLDGQRQAGDDARRLIPWLSILDLRFASRDSCSSGHRALGASPAYPAGVPCRSQAYVKSVTEQA